MNKLTHKQLKKAAAEISDVFGLEPAIDLTGDAETLTELLKEALELKTDDDEFSEATQAVIDALEMESIPEDEVAPPVEEIEEAPAPKKSAKAAKEEKSTKKSTKIVEPEPPIPPKSVVEDVEEVEEDDEEEVSEYADLIDEIFKISKIADLKDIAMENREFKGIRKTLDMYKKASDLKADMLQILEDLDGADEDMKPEPEKPSKAVKAAKKFVEAVADKKVPLPKKVSKKEAVEEDDVDTDEIYETPEKLPAKTSKSKKEVMEVRGDAKDLHADETTVQSEVVKEKRTRKSVPTGPRKRESIFATALEILGKAPFMELPDLYKKVKEKTGEDPKKNNGVRSAYLMMKRCVEMLDKNGLINKKK